MLLIEKLNVMMKERGINRSELSKLSGIPYTTIINFYEKGTDNVKLNTLRKLAEYFQCSLDYLVDEDILVDNSNQLSRISLTQRIIELRNRRVWSQVQLAKGMDVTAYHVAMWENGSWEPTKEEILKLAELFGATTDYLMGLTNELTLDFDIEKEHELLQGELYDLLKKFLEGPRNEEPIINRKLQKAIELELEKFHEFDDIEFVFTQDGIEQLLKEQNDINFTRRFIEVVERAISNASLEVPSWATPNDERDLKTMLAQDAEIMFDGVPLDSEDREKIMRVMEAIFWDEKKRNKKNTTKDE